MQTMSFFPLFLCNHCFPSFLCHPLSLTMLPLHIWITGPHCWRGHAQYPHHPLPRPLLPHPPTNWVTRLAGLDDRIARDVFAQALNPPMSPKLFIILLESCTDRGKLEDLCDGVREHGHKFNYSHRRGAKERPYNTHLYTIANPQNPAVSFSHHMWRSVEQITVDLNLSML